MDQLPANLASLTVAILKKHLTALTLQTTGKKADLVARLEEARKKIVKAKVQQTAAETSPGPSETVGSSETSGDKGSEDDKSKTQSATEPKPVVGEAPNNDSVQLDYGDDNEPQKRLTDSNHNDNDTSAPASKRAKTTTDGTETLEDQTKRDSSGELWVHIKNLLRPFTLGMLKAMLTEHGDIAEGDGTFVTDKYRTECYAQYTSSKIAKAARDKLNGVQWPPTTGRKLSVEVVSENGLAEKSAKLKAAAERRARLKAASGGKRAERSKIRLDDRKVEAYRPKTPADVELVTSEKAVVTLEQLFKKTKTLPAIYWLPVSRKSRT